MMQLDQFQTNKRFFRLMLLVFFPVALGVEVIKHGTFNGVVFFVALVNFGFGFLSYQLALARTGSFKKFLIWGGLIYLVASVAYFLLQAGSLSFTWNAGASTPAIEDGVVLLRGWLTLAGIYLPYVFAFTGFLLFAARVKDNIKT